MNRKITRLGLLAISVLCIVRTGPTEAGVQTLAELRSTAGGIHLQKEGPPRSRFPGYGRTQSLEIDLPRNRDRSHRFDTDLLILPSRYRILARDNGYPRSNPRVGASISQSRGGRAR